MRWWFIERGGGVEGVIKWILGAAGGGGSPLARKWGLWKWHHLHPPPILCGKQGLCWTDESMPIVQGWDNDGRGGGAMVDQHWRAHQRMSSASPCLPCFTSDSYAQSLRSSYGPWPIQWDLTLNVEVVSIILLCVVSPPHTFDTGYWHIPANSYAHHRSPCAPLPNPPTLKKHY